MGDFFQNVSRYPRYLITISLGVLYTFVQPLIPLFKNPVTATAITVFLLAGLAFIAFTLRAMLGFGGAIV